MVSRKVTRYTINATDEPEFEVHVEYAGYDRWAIRHGGRCLSKDGRWDWEPLPSSRTDAWLQSHRFTEGEALRIAEEQAVTVTVNGLMAADVVAGPN